MNASVRLGEELTRRIDEIRDEVREAGDRGIPGPLIAVTRLGKARAGPGVRAADDVRHRL
jgi:hypothetical protein